MTISTTEDTIMVNQQDYINFLSNLEVGDSVTYVKRGLTGVIQSKHTITVDRVTDSSIFVGTNRYLKSSGKLVGGNSNFPKPATKEEIQTADKYKIIQKIQNTDFTKLSNEQLTLISEILDTL